MSRPTWIGWSAFFRIRCGSGTARNLNLRLPRVHLIDETFAFQADPDVFFVQFVDEGPDRFFCLGFDPDIPHLFWRHQLKDPRKMHSRGVGMRPSWVFPKMPLAKDAGIFD